MRILRAVALEAALVAGTLFIPLPVSAQTEIPTPPCADPLLGNTLTAWNGPATVTLQTAKDAAGTSKVTAPIGQRVHIALSEQVRLIKRTRNDMPKEDIYKGLVSFTVPEDGTYRLGIVEGSWVDVFQNGKAVESTAFGRGPECKGKHVDFPLKAGSAVLQIFGAPYGQADFLLVKLQ
jgi:hypothetical protein